MIVKFSLQTRKIGSKVETEVEVEDGTPDEEIDQMLTEWVLENSNANWQLTGE